MDCNYFIWLIDASLFCYQLRFPPHFGQHLFLWVFCMLSTVALCCTFWFFVDCNYFIWLMLHGFFTICMDFSRVILKFSVSSCFCTSG